MAFRRENSDRPLIAQYNSIFLGHPPDSLPRPAHPEPPLAPSARALSPFLYAPTTPFAVAGSFCSERASRVYRDRRTRFVGLIQFTYRWPMSHSFVFLLLPLSSLYVSHSNVRAMMFPFLLSPLPSAAVISPSSPRDRFRDLMCERLDRRHAPSLGENSRGENSRGFANP